MGLGDTVAPGDNSYGCHLDSKAQCREDGTEGERISIPYHQVIVSVTPVVLISIGIVL